MEAQGGGPNGQKPAPYPDKDDRHGSSKHHGGYDDYSSHHKYGHDKPKGPGPGAFDLGGTIF